MPWAMIILSVLVNGNEVPPLLLLPLPLPLLPEPEPEPEPLEVRDLDRSIEDCPMSQCSVKSVSGELEPGFVVPKAQMMYSVPTVAT